MDVVWIFQNILQINCLFFEFRSSLSKDEEPHVKKTMKNKREITEYLCKVDQVRIIVQKL